jgi:hypothetical protein
VQDEILWQFKSNYGHLTLREMSCLTGIQLTRLFRIFNGSKMRLEEYALLRKTLPEKESELLSLASRCLNSLSAAGICELEQLLQRKLDLWELCKRGLSTSTKENIHAA